MTLSLRTHRRATAAGRAATASRPASGAAAGPTRGATRTAVAVAVASARILPKLVSLAVGVCNRVIDPSKERPVALTAAAVTAAVIAVTRSES